MTSWTSDPTAARLTNVVTGVRWWRTLRVRTALAIALLAALLVSGVGLILAHVALESGTALLRQEAVAQVNASLAVLSFGGGPPPGVILDAEKLPSTLVHAISTQRTPGAVTWSDGRRMWAARPAQPGGIIAISVPNAPLLAQAERISTTLLWTVATAVLLSALVAWIVADRLTARLREAAASVNQTIRGEQTPQPRQRDEVTVMTMALSSTAAALTARLHREQAFTSDVAHDLRTPLTALVGAVELLDDSPASDRARRQVDRMRRLVEDLLELARADQHDPGAHSSIRLSSIARDALEYLGPTDDCVLTVRRDAVVQADPIRLRSALINLLQNARRHGRAPIDITVDQTAISVSDRGPGLPDRLLADGPRRFQALGATGGSGLGLAIVIEHVHSTGARLTLANGVHGGARVTIGFPGGTGRAE